MKRGRLVFFVITMMMLSSCEFKCNVGKDAGKKETEKGETEKTTRVEQVPEEKQYPPKIQNNIELNTNGIRINKAYLATESGDPVDESNTVSLGEKISLVINIDSGWKIINGNSFIGATQQIITDNGTMILDTQDLFAASNQSGLDATDAKLVTLKAKITSQTGPIKFYIVKFRVWDKKGTGEINGSYKFFIK